VLKLVPVAEAGVPPAAVQANVYGVVPPVAVTVQLTIAPTVPVLGHEIVTVKGGAEPIVCVAVAVFALPSVTVRVTVNGPVVE
jgi:hypothetical protein